MAKAKYEHCLVRDLRREVHARLKLPELNWTKESPEAFWSRVEKAGLLLEALALYDRLAAELAASRRVRRETKPEFERRIDQEGRQAEAERVRRELLAAGLSQREVQEELVRRLQPLDGSQTRAWNTPDPWQAGRLFRDGENEQYLVRVAETGDVDDYDDEYVDVDEVKARVAWARLRREEGNALSAARRRARRLEATTQTALAGTSAG